MTTLASSTVVVDAEVTSLIGLPLLQNVTPWNNDVEVYINEQVVHPSVIDFLTEHGIPRWPDNNGYRYWMFITPYPASNDAYENPSLVASHDGYNWVKPAAITNPFESAAGSPGPHCADTEIVYDPANDLLMCYWIVTDRPDNDANDYARIRHCTVDNTLTVSSISTIIETVWGFLKLSPTVIREDATHWHMWNVERDVSTGYSDPDNYYIYYRSSSDGVTWSERTQCNDITRTAFGLWPWHLQAKYNSDDGRVEIFLCAEKSTLVYLETTFSTPTVLTAPIMEYVLAGSGGDVLWDRAGIYRASFVRTRIVSDNYYNLWYTNLPDGLGPWQLARTSAYIDKTTGLRSLYTASAPTLSSPAATANGQTGATLGVTTDVANGALYWVVTESATAPTVAQILAGQDHTGATAAASSIQLVTASGAISGIAVTGLSAATTYYAHFLHEDVKPQRSNIVTSASFTTEAA